MMIEANLSPEDKKAYSKIKKLIVSRDTVKFLFFNAMARLCIAAPPMAIK